MYKNDMPENIQSRIKLFADNIFMYLTISNQSDCKALQRDLSKLELWVREWLVAFYPDKCVVITVTKKKKPFFFFTINSMAQHFSLQNKNAKYQMISSGVKKENNTLKFIKRNTQTCNSKIKETAYKTYGMPPLEYSSSVWDPWQEKYIHQLKMVQHRAVKYILNDYASSVTAMLNKLGLPTLENRRKIAFLVMLYKIHTGQIRNTSPPHNITGSPFHTLGLTLTCTLSSLELQDYGIISPLTWSAAQTWRHSGLGWLYTFSKHP